MAAAIRRQHTNHGGVHMTKRDKHERSAYLLRAGDKTPREHF